MVYTKENLEAALKEHEEAERVVSIISAEFDKFLESGENHQSTLMRVRMKVLLGNGKVSSRSLILKVPPSGEAICQLVNNSGFFKTEAMVYANVLKEMEALMQEFGDQNDVLWCKMIHVVPYSSIILEDLKACGFGLADRRQYYDMDLTVLVLQCLGRFHGMAKILEQRGLISPDDFKPYPLTNDELLMKAIVYSGIQCLSAAIEKSWGEQWAPVASKLKMSFEKYKNLAISVGQVDEKKFNCLNHGDCWANNIMFKCDYKHRPAAVRLLDLQYSHYNSAVMDVLYFIYTSVDPKIRRDNLEELIKIWHQSLTETLNRYKYLGRKPSYEEFQTEIRNMPVMKLTSIIVNILSKGDSTKPVDFNEALMSGIAGHDEKVYMDQGLKARWGHELLEIVKILP